MCYSAQIQADFRAYQRFGAPWTSMPTSRWPDGPKRNDTWIQSVPKGIRNAFLDSAEPDEQEARAAALDAYQAATLALKQELAEQTARLAKAQSVLACAKLTKKAETDRRSRPRRSRRPRQN